MINMRNAFSYKRAHELMARIERTKQTQLN